MQLSKESHNIARRGLADFDLYPYNPSATAGWAFVVMFGIGGLFHFIEMFRLRAWFFIPFLFGCIGEAFGYYGRAWSHDNIRNGGPFLLQLMLILSSAALLSATIYMSLGRLIRALDAEHHAVMRTRWLTKIYVVIDVGSFVCQMMGSAMQASGDENGMKQGTTLVMGGLGIQLFAFICFILMAVVTHRRLNNDPIMLSKTRFVPWRRHMWTLYIVSILILVRSVFRLIEFVSGHDGPLMKHEVYLYVFDASLMLLVVLSLSIVHPGRLLVLVRRLGANARVGDEEAFIRMDSRQH